MEILVNKLRVLRGKMSQQKIADIFGVTQRTYSDYETGRTQIPDDIKIRLADYFNVSVDYLLGREEHKKLPDGFPPSSQFDEDLKKIGFSIDTYNSMTKEEQQTLLTMLEALIEKFAQNKK